MRFSRWFTFVALLVMGIASVGSIAAQQENTPLPVERPFFGAIVERSEQGAVVTRVLPNSPAEAAGVQVGDIIVSVNDVAISDRLEFVRMLRTLEIGSQITLNVTRDGTSNTILVAELTARPLAGRLAQNRLGITFTVSDSGVEIVSVQPDSAAAEVGFQQGDVITAVDGQPLNEENRLRDFVLNHAPGDTVTFTVTRGGAAVDLTWTIPTLREMLDRAERSPFGGREGAPFADPTGTPAPGAHL